MYPKEYLILGNLDSNNKEKKVWFLYIRKGRDKEYTWYDNGDVKNNSSLCRDIELVTWREQMELKPEDS